ncbi:MAG TPA: IS1182 family transposase, partial [Anaerolineales bacterium]
MFWRSVDVEKLVAEDHAARAIWEFVGRLDLSGYYQAIESSPEVGGRPAFDPQLLISLWVYAYSLGIGSAREIARRCEWEPGFQWLTGGEVVNYHTLAEVRVEWGRQLEETFTQVLGLLSAEGLIALEQVMQDGTKIRALASGKSFRRERELRRHLERVREYVREVGSSEAESENARTRAARQRAERERGQRWERAVAELRRLQASKSDAKVSLSDPEARFMKQSDGGFAPSYNVQISADAAHGAIVGLEVVKDHNDRHQLVSALERMQQQMGRQPQHMTADGEYTTRANIEALQQRGVDFIGSLREKPTPEEHPWSAQAFVYDPQQDRYVCPQGKLLRPEGWQTRGGVRYHRYRARRRDCESCPQQAVCCPGHHSRNLLRAEPSPAVEAFRQKMSTAEAKALYRKRGPVVEFCHAWIKSKLGLRQFHV